MSSFSRLLFFLFPAPPTTDIYTLSLHDALPIWTLAVARGQLRPHSYPPVLRERAGIRQGLELDRSEEHTSELQSLTNLVCRLLLEKKKTTSQVVRNHLAAGSSLTAAPRLGGGEI